MNHGVLFNRGLCAQYTKKHYLKAKQYYKNAVLTKVKSRYAVGSWLNKMITCHEPLTSCLKYLKKHKSLWKNKPEEYKLIKENIKKVYNSKKDEEMLNLIEIYDVDKNKSKYKWENTELYVRRLLKYDPLILHVHTFHEIKGEKLQKNMRHYTTSRSTSRTHIYVAELAIDVSTSKVTRIKNLSFHYDMISASNVKVNDEDYYTWMSKADPNFTVLTEALYWTNQMTDNISTGILKGVDFRMIEDSDESEIEEKVEKKETTFEIDSWKDFHFNSDIH